MGFACETGPFVAETPEVHLSSYLPNAYGGVIIFSTSTAVEYKKDGLRDYSSAKDCDVGYIPENL